MSNAVVSAIGPIMIFSHYFVYSDLRFIFAVIGLSLLPLLSISLFFISFTLRLKTRSWRDGFVVSLLLNAVPSLAVLSNIVDLLTT